MYIVTKNNPYYPEVEYYETLEFSLAQRDVWIDEMKSLRGTFECKVTVASVIETTVVSSDY